MKTRRLKTCVDGVIHQKNVNANDKLSLAANVTKLHGYECHLLTCRKFVMTITMLLS